MKRRTFLTAGASAAAAAALSRSAFAQTQGFAIGPEPIRYPSGVWKVLDERFRKYMIGNTPLVREWTGAMWAEGPAWNGVGRYVVFSDIPEQRADALGRSDRKSHAAARAVELFERQHVRLPGAADLVRAPDRARRAIRISGGADGARVHVRRQAAERAERRDRASERRRHSLHRSRLRQPLVLRRHRPRARAADERLPHRSADGAPHEADRRDPEAERALLFARLPLPLRRRHGADASSKREGEDHPVGRAGQRPASDEPPRVRRARRRLS